MTRQEYMQQLAALLAAMPEAERRDALDYYEEYFDAGVTESDVQDAEDWFNCILNANEMIDLSLIHI